MTLGGRATDVEISLLGGLSLRRAAGRPIELTGRKDCALLGFLAASPGVPYPRERLAALLWGRSGDRQARDSLKQALLRLRRTLAGAGHPLLLGDRSSITLDAAAAVIDLVLFERLIGEPTTEGLERAILLYRGDLLEGVSVREPAFEDWLLVERQRLRQLAVAAATELMSRRLAAGRRDRAADAARRLIALEPLHELACRTLMQVHADRGERAQALKLFEGLRDRLQRELGVVPEPDTLRLHQSIRARRETAPAVDGGAGEAMPAPAASGPDRHAEPAPAVAVLPFLNIGEDPEPGFLADGLTEDIITDLSRVSGLRVASRGRVFALRDRAMPVAELAGELKVSHLLEGTVRRAAERVRITAQLVDAVAGTPVWAQRYDRRLDDIFTLQDEITASIVGALKVQLLPEEAEAIATRSTASVEAYEYYLTGRSFYLRGIDSHSLRIARDMFARAAELDRQYARAYAGIAICESYLSMRDPDATFDASLRNSQRALELDPYLAEAHAVKGLALYADGRYGEAEPAFQRALELDPDLFEADFFYARNCRLQGRHEAAVPLFRRAAALRPTDFRSLGLLGESLKALGRRDEMLAAWRQCLARLETEIAAHPDNAGALAFGSAVLAELGQPARARDWAARAVMIAPHDYLARYNVARTYVLLGDNEAGMRTLETAFRASAVWRRRLALWMRGDADLDPLRSQPRFRLLMAGLPPP